jgi:hypothetical protein
MSSTWLRNSWLRNSCMGVLMVALSAVSASAQWPTKVRTAVPDTLLINDMVPPTQYWLGIECMPIPPALRTQLELPEPQGLLVEAVVPDSPAAKAGIVAHDILWSVGNKPLTNPLDLIREVEEIKDGNLTLEIIHASQHKTIEATPAKRPEGAGHMSRLPGEADWNTISKWMEDHRSGEPGARVSNPLHFRFLHPGAILPKEGLQPMPANMSVVVSKEGDQPAKIVVKRGEEKWEVGEKELDKLPADVRPFVDRLLGRGAFGLAGVDSAFDLAPDVNTPGVETPNAPLPGASLEARMEQRFEEMNHRFDQIMKSLNESVSNRAKPKAEAIERPAEESNK